MKRILMVAALMGGLVVVGCEEKKAEPAKDVKGTASKAAEAVKDTAGKAAEGVKDTAGKAAEAVKDTAGKAAEAVKDTAGKAAEGVKDAAGKAADATKQAAADAAAKAHADALASVRGKVDGIQGQLDAIKKKVDALPELVRKPAQEALATAEKKYTDLKASFGGLEKATGDEFTKLSGEIATRATALSDEIAKIAK
ncbi:MAG: hypothetical protein ACOYN0_17310 [Phycisphaerales bacterium]